MVLCFHCSCGRTFFLLMIRRPPRSTRTDTLFPYTTLFRSPGEQGSMNRFCFLFAALLAFLPGVPAAAEPARTPVIILVSIDGFRARSEEHTSELQSLMRISYAVFCLKKKKHINNEGPIKSEGTNTNLIKLLHKTCSSI